MPGSGSSRDRPADVEIDHDRLAAVAAGADQVRVALVEEEVVDRLLHLGPAHREALAVPTASSMPCS